MVGGSTSAQHIAKALAVGRSFLVSRLERRETPFAPVFGNVP
jgi:hypothetical protein